MMKRIYIPKVVLNINVCILLLLILTLVSCSSVETMRISVQKPAQMTMPISVQNITVVNNAVSQPDTLGHTQYIKGKEKEVIVSSDSLSLILTQSLAQFMSDENFYGQVVAYDRPLRSDNLFLIEQIIDSATIRSISESTNADAIISIDRFITRSILREYIVSNVLEVRMQGKFRVYSNDGRLISYPIMFEDTLFWEQPNIPTQEAALKQSAIHTADKMLSMFIPSWQDQNRWYHTSSKTKMKQAATKATANDWKGAALLWGELYNKEEKNLAKARLASNISLANEMLDDIDNALTWSRISIEHYSKEKNKQNIEDEIVKANAVKEELEQRKKDSLKLDKQKGINTLEDSFKE